MSKEDASSGNGVTEDEAALYDRQIRLWGLEAQGRIRTSHILVINLDGLTTEAIKNWVLAGIHRLTLVDVRQTTAGHDLSAGFFWREEDVGQDRLPSAAARIQALNPLVKIDILPSSAVAELFDASSSRLPDLNPNVLVVGMPSGPQSNNALWTRESLCALNDRARSLQIPFYCAGTLGLDGWVFNDLGEVHEYVIERPDLTVPVSAATVEGAAHDASVPPAQVHTEASASSSTSAPAPPATGAKRLEKRRYAFVPLRTALGTSWRGLPPTQVRRKKPSLGYFGALAVWACLDDADMSIPVSADKLKFEAQRIMQEHGIDVKLLVPPSVGDVDAALQEYFDALAVCIAQPGEFSPTCAILGGIMSQGVLNAIGGREEPFVNWFQFDGVTGKGVVHGLSTSASTLA